MPVAPQLIVSIAESACLSGADFGGKAVALGRLAAAGLPVPPGFVLHRAALSACVRSAGLLALCEESARAEAAGDSERAQRLGQRAAEALRQIEVPSWMIDQLATAHRGLLDTSLRAGASVRGRGLLVVRSSAAGEDGAERSHAGQYESVLNLRGLSALVDGLHAVWASWYSERAIDYRLHLRGALPPPERAGLQGEATVPPMAVLVQSLVPARASGMLFTANPVTGALDEMTVEAGLCSHPRIPGKRRDGRRRRGGRRRRHGRR